MYIVHFYMGTTMGYIAGTVHCIISEIAFPTATILFDIYGCRRFGYWESCEFICTLIITAFSFITLVIVANVFSRNLKKKVLKKRTWESRKTMFKIWSQESMESLKNNSDFPSRHSWRLQCRPWSPEPITKVCQVSLEIAVFCININQTWFWFWFHLITN